MRSVIYIALSALAALAAADNGNPFRIPNGGYSFQAGSATTLNWDPTSHGTVTLKLQWGSVSTPKDGITIACECIYALGTSILYERLFADLT